MTPDAPAGFEVPASPGQRQLWLVQQLARGSSAYHMPFALELDGALDVGALRSALQAVVDRHEALRTRFVERDGTLFQVIDATQTLAFSTGEVPGEDALHRESLRLAEAPFDLASGPLLRCRLLQHAPGRARLVVVFHHLVADGWSLDVFASELVAAYRAALAGSVWAPPELPLQYADLSEHQRELLEAGGAEAALAHFRTVLAGAEPARAPSLPGSGEPAGQARVHRFSVSADPVRSLARARKTTPFAVLLAATQLAVQRLTGEAAPCVGTVASGRDRSETHGLIGYFVNTLPLRDAVDPRASFAAVVDRAALTAQRAFDHQALPFDTLVQSLPVPRDERGQALFRVMLVLNPSVAPPLELPGLSARGAELPTGEAKFDLVLSFSEAGEALHAHLEYDSRFHPHGIATLGEVLTQLLEHGPRTPDVEAARWLAATPAQAAQLDALEHGPAEPLDVTASVASSIERWVRQTPEALALRGPSGQLDYRELWRRSGRVAAALGALPADAVVAVWAPRSVETLVAVLGVVRAGGATLAFDPGLPPERARRLAAAAGVKAVVASAELAAQARTLEVPVLDLGGSDGAPPPTAPGGQRLLYVAFTSGSTGEPKGVAVPHAAVQRLLGAPSFVALGNDTRMLHAAPLAFDASTLEVWGPWLHGGAVVVAPPELSPASLEATLRDGAVTVAWLTSGLFQTLLDERPGAFAGLRWLLTGGDVVSPAHARRVLELVPGLRLVNGYGPTECTTFACCHVVAAPDEVASPLPIGRPINRTRALILDDFGRRAPPGFEGELFLGGDGLARGYVSRPDLTAERFGPAPDGGGRLYRTGDRARFDPDRAVQFLGRRDAQVKVRGHRIELAEVEALARGLTGVRDAVAFVVGDGVDTRALHAALVLSPGAAFDEAALSRALGERAPAHLVPSRLWSLPAIPLGATGKPDRARLGRELLASAAPAVPQHFDAPEAKVVAQVFEELLGGGPLGPHDDFFLRGGHSLLAMRATARLEERLGKPVALAEFFEHPTPEGLARALAEKGALTAAADFPREGPFPLSRAQQRLWFLQQLEPDSAFYASYAAFHLERRLDVAALEQALRTLAARHEGLRVRFQLLEGTPHQVPAEPAWPLTVARADDEATRTALLERFANTPFDLERDPPLRALWVDEGDGGALLFVLHHLVTDGESLRLLLGELADLLSGRALEAPPASYRAFVAREAEEAKGAAHAEAERFWAQALRGPLPVLELPRDFARPKVLSSAGATVSHRLDGELVRTLGHRAARAGATPFAWLLAATGAYLGRLAGQDEVVVATPATARAGAAFARTQGFFANTIALRAAADPAQRFDALAGAAHAALREALRHQQVPFDRVVELAAPERSTAHAPVAQVMLSVVEHGAAEASLAGVRATPLEVAVRGAAFELTLIVDLGGGALHAEYATDLFEADTVARWLQGFAGFLAAALEDPARAVGQLPLLPPQQRQQVLAAGRGAVHPGAG
ncbi:MAG: amino acid adenylation domain-containing protein, partial [Myxococcaceae bacterium]|nr:amino acid adenylation domain-containing protein [Myxococcaceae bacterium]